MKGHLYRIQLERIEDIKGLPVLEQPLIFTTRNHDDIKTIVAKMQSRPEFSSEDATALAVGLKLFSEVMLKHRDLPLFTDLRTAMGSFIKTLKTQH